MDHILNELLHPKAVDYILSELLHPEVTPSAQLTGRKDPDTNER